MNQYDEALKKETAFLGQPRGGGDSQLCTALFVFFELRNECRNDLITCMQMHLQVLDSIKRMQHS